MHGKEMTLTGLALSLLAYWELSIGAIPLGLFNISHAEQRLLFSGIIVVKLLLSTFLLSRGVLRLAGEHRLHLRLGDSFRHPHHPTPGAKP